MAREEELIEQIKNGRKECLDELVAFYYPAILRYCLWHMPDRESALDATQETFLKLVRFLGQYENRGAFRAFLYRIAANTCIDMKRKHPVTESLSEAVSEAVCAPECGYQTVEDRQQLATALTHLDNSMRELILLRYGQELTMREISDITGLPLRTVQTRLRKAVKIMREVLK
ncbi:MAG: RNA polymerase sigma factor [Lachnospiraceae bacterium]|nr:RNA polymerase sigma factor [Lachnospiraceae bacterium]